MKFPRKDNGRDKETNKNSITTGIKYFRSTFRKSLENVESTRKLKVKAEGNKKRSIYELRHLPGTRRVDFIISHLHVCLHAECNTDVALSADDDEAGRKYIL